MIEYGVSRTITWYLTLGSPADPDLGDTVSLSIADSTRGSVAADPQDPTRWTWSITVNEQDVGHTVLSRVRTTDSHGLWTDSDLFVMVQHSVPGVPESYAWPPTAHRTVFGTASGNPVSQQRSAERRV